MTRSTHTIDGVQYCGTLETTLPFVGMRDAAQGPCSIGPDPNRVLIVLAHYPPQTQTITLDATSLEGLFGIGRIGGPVLPDPGTPGASPMFRIAAGKHIAVQLFPSRWARTSVQLKSNNNYQGAPLDCCVGNEPGVFAGQAPFFVQNIGPTNKAFVTMRNFGESNPAVVRVEDGMWLNLRISSGLMGDMHLVSI